MSKSITTNLLKCDNLIFNDIKYNNSMVLHIKNIVNFSNSIAVVQYKYYLSSSTSNSFTANKIYKCKSSTSNIVQNINNFETPITPTEGLIIYVEDGDFTYIYSNGTFILLDFTDIDITNYNNGNFEVILNNKNNINFESSIKINNPITINNQIVLNDNNRILDIPLSSEKGFCDFFNFYFLNYPDDVSLRPFCIHCGYASTSLFYNIGIFKLGLLKSDGSQYAEAVGTFSGLGVQFPANYITLFHYIEIQFSIGIKYDFDAQIYLHSITFNNKTFYFKDKENNRIRGKYYLTTHDLNNKTSPVGHKNRESFLFSRYDTNASLNHYNNFIALGDEYANTLVYSGSDIKNYSFCIHINELCILQKSNDYIDLS